MIIIPAIDIKDNKCVRLSQGKIENVEVFFDDPLVVAKKWEEKGAGLIHVVDLDGAFQGKPVHFKIIKKIARELSIPIQVGGGIRQEKTIEQYLDIGVKRIVLGSALLEKGEKEIEYLLKKFGKHLIAGIDVKNDNIAIHGWVQKIEKPVEQFIHNLNMMGLQRIIYTDIHRDGMMSGLNIDMIKKVALASKMKIISSGGVSSMEDLFQLQSLGISNLEGVIIGKALYRNEIVLEEAINIFQKKEGA